MDESKQLKLVYDKIAEFYAKKFSEPSEHIKEFLALLPQNTKILDIGCGVGVNTNFMVLEGFEVIGIDLSKGMLKIAKHKFPQIDFRQQNIKKLNFSSNSFNGILASFSLIHISKKDIPMLLKKFHQILKKNGAIYIALQGGKSEEVFIDAPFRINEELFLNVFSFNEIKNLLIKNKFSIVKSYKRKPKLRKELNYIKFYIIAKKTTE